jgi:YegS/Rv2252/BmrU family lipid kinase
VSDPGWLVLANSLAGGHDEAAIDRVAGELGRGGEVEVVDCADGIDRQLDRAGDRVVVVAGGDGTLHAVVQALWDRGELRETTLGILPLGTGNDLARGLDIPLAPVAAAAAIRFGRPAPVDLVVDDTGTVVVNAAHAGVGAEAGVRAAPLKRWLGSYAYHVGAALAGARTDGWQLTVEVDGERVGGDLVLLVAVMNGRSIGGGSPLAPAADPADGLAHVVVACTDGIAHRIELARGLRSGTHLDVTGVSCTTGTEVRISGEPVRHNVDGELTEPLAERVYRVVPGAWRVLRAPGG